MSTFSPKTSLSEKYPFVLSMGPQRAGTSWLDRYLRKRGDICLPSDVKEVFFFDRHYDRGSKFYESHFSLEKNHKFAMEISTTSFDHVDSPKRVKETFGDNVILLCPLRDPITRSYSLYLHYVRYGIVNSGIKQACTHTPQIIDSSRYAKHIENWISVFSKEQIHFVFQEDLEKNSESYVKNICEILSIPYIPIEQKMNKRYNATTHSKSGTLAGAAQKGADWLRKHRLYSVINIAKTLGLKRAIFGKENPDAKDNEIPPEDKAFLHTHLGEEIQKLEALIGPIPQWHSNKALHAA